MAERKPPKAKSAAGRQAADYHPPVLVEPRGGPIPKSGQKRSAVRHLPGKHNQISHAHGGGHGGSGGDSDDDSTAPAVKVRTQEGSMHLSRRGGRLSIRMPTPDFDDDLLDTVTLDDSTSAEFVEELQAIEESGTDYNRRVKKLWNAATAINPDGGGEADPDPKSKAAWDAVGKLAGDGQRITGGQIDADGGAELHYELRMGDEPGDMELLIAVRPPDAGDDWDIHEAAADQAGAFLSWSQFRKLRQEVASLLASD